MTKKWLILLMVLMFVPAAFAVRERVERPAALTMVFNPDARAEVRLTATGSVDELIVWLGDQGYRLPPEACRKLRDLRVETMRLRWDGRFKTAQQSPYFYLRFAFGQERERRFGDLPEIELIFRGGVYVEGNILRKVSADEWLYSALEK
jgi:hypothetical protein